MFGYKQQSSKDGRRIILRALAVVLFLSPFAFGLRASAQPAGVRPPVLKDVGIDQLLNNQVPLDLEFRDEDGRTVKLADYFKDKPVVLSLVYYNCPQLCTQVLTGLLGTLRTLPMDWPLPYDMVTVQVSSCLGTTISETRSFASPITRATATSSRRSPRRRMRST